ncbi:MAG: nucleotidyltransferase family protein [Candidatus Asgardarchaeia archaeon]
MISAVILAAGESRRMGLGKSKVLLKLNEETIIERLIHVLQDSNVSDIIVVLGHNPEEIESVIRNYDVKIVYNYAYEHEMTSSFIMGLSRVSMLSEAAFLVLGDQPLLTKKLITDMLDAYEKTSALIISPIYKGKKGHPVLFDRTLFTEILSLGPHGIIRDIIHRHRGRMITVKADIGAVFDIDTPEDYKKAKELALKLLS